LLAGALAVAAAATVITAVVVSRPSPASALAVIRQARAAFAHMPPFQATYQVALNPGGGEAAFKAQGVPKGATETVVVNYGGPDRFRTQILAEHLIPLTHTATPRAGSYQVFDGRTFATYNSLYKRFDSSPAHEIPALENLSWNGASPDWERVCRGSHSTVLADGEIAGRDARHIRCTDFTGDTWELWIDRQTGLLLKIVGQVGADDFFFGGGVGTSAKGGFEIEKLRYNPSFPAATFSVKPPPGAVDSQALVRAALAKVPPFRAVVYYRGGSSRTEEMWWLNSQTWRDKTLAGVGIWASSVGNFSVSGPGGQVIYDAHHKTFFRSAYSADSDPALVLLPLTYAYSPAECSIVGHDRVAGHDAVHRHCPVRRSRIGVPIASADIWVDSATGLLLEAETAGSEHARRPEIFGPSFRVISIVYRPAFTPGTLRFVAPPGSTSQQRLSKLEESPYYKTKLAPGKPAPNWHATTLVGKPFQLTDLRGKPALILVLAEWCSDPACDELAPLERAYQSSNHRTEVIWVEVQGTARQAKKIARLNRVTFPVVVDSGEPGAVIKAWAIQGVPYFLLLDSRGQVIEAHFHQTTAQLTRMLAERRAPR
jgi:hypothetical protein